MKRKIVRNRCRNVTQFGSSKRTKIYRKISKTKILKFHYRVHRGILDNLPSLIIIHAAFRRSCQEGDVRASTPTCPRLVSRWSLDTA